MNERPFAGEESTYHISQSRESKPYTHERITPSPSSERTASTCLQNSVYKPFAVVVAAESKDEGCVESLAKEESGQGERITVVPRAKRPLTLLHRKQRTDLRGPFLPRSLSGKILCYDHLQ